MKSISYARVSALALALLMIPGCMRNKEEKVERAPQQEVAAPEVVAEEQAKSAPVKAAKSKKAKKHDGVVEIKGKQHFDDILAEGRLVIADFYAPYCGPCKQAKPVFKELSHEYPDVTFVAINSDEASNNVLFDTYNVTGFPRFIFIDAAGNVFAEKAGFKSKADLKSNIDDFVKSAVQP